MESGRNISLTVAYDGTNYHGWQRQPNAVTVEGALRTSVEKMLDHEVKIIAGARTDTGVHAMGQVINFTVFREIDNEHLARGLNSMLPRDIRVREARLADPEFHSRYSAQSKTYVYCILNQMHNSPFLTRYVLHVPHSLDVAAMKHTVRAVVGEHDFSAFKKKDEVYRNPVRFVKRAGVVQKGTMVYVVIEATGFLRYMVRNIVGTLLLAGRGKLSDEEFRAILESREREQAGPTAPPQGLFLRKIRY